MGACMSASLQPATLFACCQYTCAKQGTPAVRTLGTRCPSSLPLQVSDPLWLKFTGLLGVVQAALLQGARPEQVLVLSPDPWQGVQAMQAHHSQWVW
jgi:hypothetical protein